MAAPCAGSWCDRIPGARVRFPSCCRGLPMGNCVLTPISRVPVLTSSSSGAREPTFPALSANGVTDALERVEPGPARDVLEGHLSKDLAAVDDHGLAGLGRYTSIPIEALPHLAHIALRRGLDIDAFLTELDTLFAPLGRSRADARELRSLLVLSEAGGGDTPALVRQLLNSSLSKHDVARVVRAILAESPQGVTAGQIAEAIDLLGHHENPARIINQRMTEAVLQRFNLTQLRSDGAGRITEKGLHEVTGKLMPFFSRGLVATGANDKRTGKPTFDEKSLEAILMAVLEDRFDAFRFTTAKAEHQLKSLNADQRAKFIDGQEMLHVRFSGNGEQMFHERVEFAARAGAELLARMEKAWGPVGRVRAEHARLVETLRGIDKNDRAARKPLLARIQPLSDRKVAMDHAETLARL
ncbi:MAG: hypothetical protein IPO66_23665, partial [Rhodanobacteraceae bacterium]|nr:hypothetical protein [Rhodanobacteraceae bacterium]